MLSYNSHWSSQSKYLFIKIVPLTCCLLDVYTACTYVIKTIPEVFGYRCSSEKKATQYISSAHSGSFRIKLDDTCTNTNEVSNQVDCYASVNQRHIISPRMSYLYILNLLDKLIRALLNK